MEKKRFVRKNLRLRADRLDEAKKILGTSTDAETIEQALDSVIFRKEVLEGIDRIAGTRVVRNTPGFESE